MGAVILPIPHGAVSHDRSRDFRGLGLHAPPSPRRRAGTERWALHQEPGFVKSYVDLEIAIVADVNIRSEGELREHYLFLHRVPSLALNSKLTSDAPPLIVAVQMLETLRRQVMPTVCLALASFAK